MIDKVSKENHKPGLRGTTPCCALSIYQENKEKVQKKQEENTKNNKIRHWFRKYPEES